MEKRKTKALFQVFLLISAVFAYSYIIRDNGELIDSVIDYKENSSVGFYEKLVRFILKDDNLVSAQGLEDVPDGNSDTNTEDSSTTDASNEESSSNSQTSNNPIGISDLLLAISMLQGGASLDDLTNAFGTDGLTQIGNLAGLEGLPDVSSGNPLQILQSIRDSTKNGGTSICKRTKENKICQVYTTEDCGSVCSSPCVQISSFDSGEANNIPDECTLGVCLDKEFGTCQPRSTKGECQAEEGIFNEDGNNLAECRKGCCFLGDQGKFLTEQQCRTKVESLGLEFGGEDGLAYFDGEIISEPVCLQQAIVNAGEKGACTFPGEEDDEKDCRFTTLEECTNSINGDFNPGKLCSHPELETICEPKNNTACDVELDGVYWYDSCGNRENIFDKSAPQDGWNNGEILPREEVCKVGGGNSPTENQESCGNCNRFLGNSCAEETSGQELNDNPDGNVICLDLSCGVQEGEKRENGESWCAYQSSIGLGSEVSDIPFLGAITSYLDLGPLSSILGGQRSTDTPGSRHFRKSCIDGKIVTEPCQNYRNEICVEDENNKESREFSSASCVINRWQECLNYNPKRTGKAGSKMQSQILVASMLKCGQDPDCFVKYVNVDKDFSFPTCLPRYPPGFDRENPEAAETICGIATQTCNVIKVKQAFGGDKIYNAECEKAGLVGDKLFEQMNDMCISLGDCGLSVNYVGDYGAVGSAYIREGKARGFGLPKPRIPGALYLAMLGKLAEPIEGKFIEGDHEKRLESAGKSSEGFLKGFGQGGGPGYGGVSSLGGGGVGRGGGGVQRPIGNFKPNIPKGGGMNGVIAGGVTGVAGVAALSTTPVSALGGPLIGAAAGMAITGYLIEATGVGRGLPPAATYGLIGAAAVSGFIIGVELTSLGGALCNNPFGCIVFAIIIITILLLKLFGVGEIEKSYYTFECKPWQPPAGGERCEECGSDDFPCNKYSCESLGQSCKFIDEEPNGRCVAASSDDISGPRISSWDGPLPKKFEYQDESGRGFKIRRKEGQACMTQFEGVTFGIQLNEFGRCKLSGGGESFDEANWFGRSNTLKKNHTQVISARDLESLIPEGFAQDKITEVSLNVICKDANENPSPGNYVINLCVDPLDLTSVAVLDISPLEELLPFGTEEQEITVSTNEPAECKWGLGDKDFDSLENELNCESFECVGTVPVGVDICIKCRDHPELARTDKESERNTNDGCVPDGVITLRATETLLEIVSISPEDGTVISSGLPITTVELIVETSGGAEGEASCSYSINGQPSAFFNAPIGNIHKQIYNRLTEGEYSLDISCFDTAGNSASNSTSFSVGLDTVAPSVTRVYSDSRKLFVVTDEPAECFFVTEKPVDTGACGFNIEDGNSMNIESGSSGFVHSTNLEEGKKYHIRCKDEFGNVPSKCSIVVRESTF